MAEKLAKRKKKPATGTRRSGSRVASSSEKPVEIAYPSSTTKEQLEAQQPTKQPASARKFASGPALLVSTVKLLLRDWDRFGGILLIYAALTLVFVGGVGSTDISAVKATLTSAFHGHFKAFSTGVSLFSVVIGSDKSDVSTAGGVYQVMLFVVASLAVIWMLRQRYARNPVRIRDSFYLGMYPLVPFVIILFIMGLQLIPFVIGGVLYGDVVAGGIAVNIFERFVMGGIFFMFAAVSVYMLSSSIFAMYIATLPEATPYQSYKEAQDLVRGQRWPVLKRLMFLLLVIFGGGAIIIIPVAMFITPLAVIVFLLLSMVALVVAHGYLYALYRELL